jgi:multidrug resistance efflux pump
VGLSVQPGMTFFKIGDLSSVGVIGDICEYELPFIQVGQKAQITMAYFPAAQQSLLAYNSHFGGSVMRATLAFESFA